MRFLEEGPVAARPAPSNKEVIMIYSVPRASAAAGLGRFCFVVHSFRSARGLVRRASTYTKRARDGSNLCDDDDRGDALTE